MPLRRSLLAFSKAPLVLAVLHETLDTLWTNWMEKKIRGRTEMETGGIGVPLGLKVKETEEDGECPNRVTE